MLKNSTLQSCWDRMILVTASCVCVCVCVCVCDVFRTCRRKNIALVSKFHFNFNLIFISPCIVIYSYNTTNKMHLLSQIIYSCKTLYMFRTAFPSIIRSSKLRIQRRYVKQLLLPAAIGDEMELRSISSPIAAGSSSCLTYTVAVYVVLSSL